MKVPIAPMIKKNAYWNHKIKQFYYTTLQKQVSYAQQSFKIDEQGYY